MQRWLVGLRTSGKIGLVCLRHPSSLIFLSDSKSDCDVGHSVHTYNCLVQFNWLDLHFHKWNFERKNLNIELSTFTRHRFESAFDLSIYLLVHWLVKLKTLYSVEYGAGKPAR